MRAGPEVARSKHVVPKFRRTPARRQKPIGAILHSSLLWLQSYSYMIGQELLQFSPAALSLPRAMLLPPLPSA